MSLVRSIIALAAVAFAVLAPLFIGHALALHATRPILYALAFLLLAAVLSFVHLRMERAHTRPPHGEATH